MSLSKASRVAFFNVPINRWFQTDELLSSYWKKSGDFRPQELQDKTTDRALNFTWAMEGPLFSSSNTSHGMFLYLDKAMPCKCFKNPKRKNLYFWCHFITLLSVWFKKFNAYDNWKVAGGLNIEMSNVIEFCKTTQWKNLFLWLPINSFYDNHF